MNHITISLADPTEEFASYTDLMRTVCPARSEAALIPPRTFEHAARAGQLLSAYEPEGDPIGAILWFPDKAANSAAIDTLIVHPNWQDNGIGQALLDRLGDLLLKLDVSTVRMSINPLVAREATLALHKFDAIVDTYTRQAIPADAVHPDRLEATVELPAASATHASPPDLQEVPDEARALRVTAGDDIDHAQSAIRSCEEGKLTLDTARLQNHSTICVEIPASIDNLDQSGRQKWQDATRAVFDRLVAPPTERSSSTLPSYNVVDFQPITHESVTANTYILTSTDERSDAQNQKAPVDHHNQPRMNDPTVDDTKRGLERADQAERFSELARALRRASDAAQGQQPELTTRLEALEGRVYAADEETLRNAVDELAMVAKQDRFLVRSVTDEARLLRRLAELQYTYHPDREDEPVIYGAARIALSLIAPSRPQ